MIENDNYARRQLEYEALDEAYKAALGGVFDTYVKGEAEVAVTDLALLSLPGPKERLVRGLRLVRNCYDTMLAMLKEPVT